MRLFLVARHGQSLFNVDRVVNGDPALDRGLSEQGIEEAERLAGELAALPLDLIAVSPFPRRRVEIPLSSDIRRSRRSSSSPNPISTARAESDNGVSNPCTFVASGLLYQQPE